MSTFAETIETLKEFITLPEGWHYGEGSALPIHRVRKAALWLRFLRDAGIEQFNAFPGLSGELRIRFYSQDLMLDLLLETDNSIDVALERGKETLEYVEAVSGEKLEEILVAFLDNVCPTHAPSTTDTTTLSSVNLPRNSFQRATTAGFQFSSIVVQLEQAKASANTSPGITNTYRLPRRPTTSSRMERFPKIAASSNQHLQTAMIATTTSSIGRKVTSVK